jgi:uncharacterized protein YkwD
MMVRSCTFVLAVLSGLAGCRAYDGSATAPDPTSRHLEAELHELVNLYRQERGLPALRYSPALARIAREHSRAMAAGAAPFSHDGIEVRAQDAQRQLPLVTMGENLLRTEAVPSMAVLNALSGWLASPSHREAVEGCFDQAGAGVALDSQGRVYFTQLFVLTPAAVRRCADRHTYPGIAHRG